MKLRAPKVAKVLVVGISGLPLGTKCHLDAGPVASHIVYIIRGKVVASPKCGPW